MYVKAPRKLFSLTNELTQIYRFEIMVSNAIVVIIAKAAFYLSSLHLPSLLGTYNEHKLHRLCAHGINARLSTF